MSVLLSILTQSIITGSARLRNNNDTRWRERLAKGLAADKS